MPDALAHLLPGRAARGIGARFGQPSLEIFVLLVRQCERCVVIGDAVPEFVDQLQPLGRGDLEELPRRAFVMATSLPPTPPSCGKPGPLPQSGLPCPGQPLDCGCPWTSMSAPSLRKLSKTALLLCVGLALTYLVFAAVFRNSDMAALLAGMGATPVISGWLFGELQHWRNERASQSTAQDVRGASRARRLALLAALASLGSSVALIAVRPTDWLVIACVFDLGV